MTVMNQHIKEHMMRMAVEEVELLLCIIGELGFEGYKICMCKIQSGSYMQCAIRFGIDRESARRYWKKCVENQHDIALKKIFKLE